jgi:hypothetical protein
MMIVFASLNKFHLNMVDELLVLLWSVDKHGDAV